MFFTQSSILAGVDIFLTILLYVLFLKETQYMLFKTDSRLPHSFESL